MNRKNICFVALLLSFIVPSIYGQEYLPKQQYKQGIAYQKEEQDSLALLRLDSSRIGYLQDGYYASAAQSVFAMEQSFLKLGSPLDSIIFHYEEIRDSASTVEKYQKSESIRDLLIRLTDIYYTKGEIVKAKATLTDLHNRFQKHRKDDHTQRLDNQLKLAELKMYESHFDSTEQYVQGVLKHRRAYEEQRFHANYLLGMNSLFAGHFSKSDMMVKKLRKEKFANSLVKDQALIYDKVLTARIAYAKGDYKQGLQTLQDIHKLADTTTWVDALLYETMATGFIEEGMYDTSLALVNNALEIYEGQYALAKYHPITANLKNQEAYIYTLKSDYGYSKELVSEHIRIKKKEQMDNSLALADAYYLYGVNQLELEEYNEGLTYAQQALQIYESLYTEDHLKVALAHNLLGLCLLKNKDLTNADAQLNKALSLYKKMISNTLHVYFAKIYNDLGTLYQQRSQNDKAIEHYLKSLAIYESILGEVHPSLAYGYYNVGTLHEKEKKHMLALKDYQKAIQTNIALEVDGSVFTTPALEGVLSNMILLRTLINKAQALDIVSENIFSSKEKLKYLDTELQTYLKATDLIGKLKTSYVSQDSKLYLSETTAFVYEKGIQVSLHLYQMTKDSTYKELAFRFSEKSKVGSLLSAINELKAKKMGGIPDVLIAHEDSLIANLTHLDSELLHELNKGTKADKNRVVHLKQEFLTQKSEYKKLLDYLEKNYNKYYELKYSSYTPSIADTRAYLLDSLATSNRKKRKSNHTLIEYFEGSDSLYSFVIAEDIFEIIITPKNKQYTRLFSGLRNAIAFHQPQLYERCASDLYDKLILPALPYLHTDHLLIVPDGNSMSLPFELLHEPKGKAIVNPKKTYQQNYKKFDYLLKDYHISYSYSVSLSIEIEKYKKSYEAHKFFGMAPLFMKTEEEKVLIADQGEQKHSTLNFMPSKQSHTMKLDSLTGTQQEMRDIFDLSLKTKNQSIILMENMATETNLKRARALGFNILHLATHSTIDPEDSKKSKIILQPDTKEDGILTIDEILTLKLQADLVSLSSCQTGLGHYVQGEGVMSFCRSFFYAGTQSLLVSMWKVPDQPTAALMSDFYKRLYKKDFNKIGSLREAKLKLTKKADYADPYNWASFVLLGK